MFGRTAFHWACKSGNVDIVEKMIAHSKASKFDLAAKDIDGKTGFMIAKEEGNTDVVDLIKKTFLPKNQ